jgi:hypothetical protein
MPDPDCDKLQKELDAAAREAKDALNELFDRSSELSREAERIKNAGGFDPGEMSNPEIVDAQLGVLDHDIEVTESKIRDLERNDWRDAGAGGNVNELDRLNGRLGELEESRDKLKPIDDAFDKAGEKFDEAEQNKDNKLNDWSEHCDNDPPADDDDDRPSRPKDREPAPRPTPPPAP